MPTKKEDTKEVKKPVKRAPKKVVEVKEDAALEASEVEASEVAKGGSFIATVGRRKTSVARVRLIKNGKGLVTVNGKKLAEYLPSELCDLVVSPLKVAGLFGAVDISVKTNGGGVRGQAEAMRHGISRALLVLNPTYRASLKKLGYLTRDSRKRERKKPGLKSARRAPQWSKR